MKPADLRSYLIHLPGRRASLSTVAGFIALINLVLVLLALTATVRLLPVWSTITLAVVLTAMALWRLHHWAKDNAID